MRTLARFAQRHCRAEHLQFVIERQAVTRLDLDRGGTLGDQRVEAGQRAGDQIGLARGASRGHGRADAAAGPGDLLIGRAVEPHLELPGAVAGMDQMGVAVDQARRDPAARAVDRLRRVEGRRVGGGAGIDDPAVACSARMPSSTMPSPSPAQVISRALRHSRSQRGWSGVVMRYRLGQSDEYVWTYSTGGADVRIVVRDRAGRR